MDERGGFHNFRERYTNEQLKDFIRMAWNSDVADKEKELGRPLTDEEKGEIKISYEFIERHHKAGTIPSFSPFLSHFSSIIHLANLLGLPASLSKPPEYYYEGDRIRYIKALRAYVSKNNSTRGSLYLDVINNKVQGVPTSIYKHINNLNDILGIEMRQGNNESRNTFSDDDLLDVVKKAFEKKLS